MFNRVANAKISILIITLIHPHKVHIKRVISSCRHPKHYGLQHVHPVINGQVHVFSSPPVSALMADCGRGCCNSLEVMIVMITRSASAVSG